jgi:hypothetical protein
MPDEPWFYTESETFSNTKEYLAQGMKWAIKGGIRIRAWGSTYVVKAFSIAKRTTASAARSFWLSVTPASPSKS